MAIILVHPALAANYQAAQAVADRHGLQVMLDGAKATLEPITIPARIPSPTSWTTRRSTRPITGGDAA